MNIIVTGGAGFIGSNFVFHMLNTYPDYRIIMKRCMVTDNNSRIVSHTKGLLWIKQMILLLTL